MNRRHKKHIDLIGKKHYTEPCYPCVRDGGIRLIYLDYTANTPADPAVLEAFCRAEQAFIGNANSAHGEGRRARAEMDRALAAIGAMLGAKSGEVIPTSGVSEANNLAIQGIARAARHVGRHIVSTALALTVAMETALSRALAAFDARLEAVRALNRRLRTALSAYPKVRINSPEGAAPHILNLSVEGVRGAAAQRALDARGVCVSVKSACSVEGTPSRAVFAVSRDRKNALCSWRISLRHLTTDAEIDEFLNIFDDCYREGFR